MSSGSVTSAILALFLIACARADHAFDLTEGNWAGQKHNGSGAVLANPPEFEPGGGGALVLRGGNFIDVPGIGASDLPSGEITLEATVTLDRGTKWGNIIGYMQDNGDYERGFSLGYNESTFCAWISTGGRAIYATADTPFVAGEWYHVMASYDGRRLILAIDGELAASAEAHGDIAYPEAARFSIGAYRDQDEFYPMEGMLRDARVAGVATAISGSAIPGQRLTVRPAVHFLSPDSAQITWGAEPAGGTIAFGTTRPPQELITTSENHVVLADLAPRTIYYYKLGGGKTYSFNTALNFTQPALPASAPSAVLRQAKFHKGYCILFGADPVLAEAIASGSDLSVIAIDTDPARVASARSALYQRSHYGSRISVMHVDSYQHLPFTDGFANLVIADHASPEIGRIAAPGRSTTIIAGQPDHPPRPGTQGDWSHQYGDAGNSASGSDSLGGARKTSDLKVRWFGRPGADFGLDRQSRMPAPISVAGRLFHQGMDRLVALDANNGAVLWGLDIPDVRRLNMPRDTSNWCADDTNLYLAVKERAWVIDAENGSTSSTLPIPGEEPGLDWGYIARESDYLIGSAVRSESGYTSFWTSRAWFDGKAGAFGTGMVCSESLFAYPLGSQQSAWSYQDGLVINPTIAINSGRIYFIESRRAGLRDQRSRQINNPELWQDQFLVALDSASGNKIWERPIDLEDGDVSFYLQATPEHILVTSSNTQFHFYAFAASDGQPIWNRSTPWSADHHSGHIQHPVILDGTLYVSPNGYSMASGEILTTKVGLREGCHTYLGAGDTLIYRGQARQVTMWDRGSETISSWPRLRPSCWLSFIPANGMLLIPEGGGGCSCGGWMETSIGFAPPNLR